MPPQVLCISVPSVAEAQTAMPLSLPAKHILIPCIQICYLFKMTSTISRWGVDYHASQLTRTEDFLDSKSAYIKSSETSRPDFLCEFITIDFKKPSQKPFNHASYILFSFRDSPIGNLCFGQAYRPVSSGNSLY